MHTPYANQGPVQAELPHFICIIDVPVLGALNREWPVERGKGERFVALGLLVNDGLQEGVLGRAHLDFPSLVTVCSNMCCSFARSNSALKSLGLKVDHQKLPSHTPERVYQCEIYRFTL